MLPLKNEQPTGAVGLPTTRGASLTTIQQHARLCIGVAGAAGGLLLLAGNMASIWLGGASFALIPLSANAALVFGGVMFLRERRRVARFARKQLTRSQAPV